jgi:hypothetical protein
MGALAIVILVTLLGALSGGLGAFRLARVLGPEPRARLARCVVALLGGAAGAQIAAQLYDLVHQLQLDKRYDSLGAAGRNLHAITVIAFFREVFFYGTLLLGLAAAVGLIALRADRGRAT